MNLGRIASRRRVEFEFKLTDDFVRGVQATLSRGEEELVGWHERLAERAFDAIEKRHLAPIDELLKCAYSSGH